MKSLRMKLGFGFLVVIFLFVALLAYTNLKVNVFNTQVKQESKAFQQLMIYEKIAFNIADRMALVRGYILQGKPSYQERFKKYTDESLALQEKIVAAGVTAETQKAIDQSIEFNRLVMEEVFTAYEKGDIEGAKKLVTGDVAVAGGNAINGFNAVIKTMEEESQARMMAMIETGDNVLLTNIVLAIAVAILAVLIALYLANGLTKPILLVIGQLEKVAQGDFRVNELRVRTKDEVGRLVSTMNKMTHNLRSFVLDVAESAQVVASSSQELTASAEETARSAEHVTNAIQTVAEGTNVSIARAEESARAIEEMTQGVLRIAESTALVSDLSQTALQDANEGDESIKRIIHQMHSIDRQVSESASVVKTLGEHSEEIEQIVSVITGIASQTNLLALNAAIEAARAGEHGRGFAVVADEVRKLAEQSEESARQISELIRQIQAQTDKAVLAMEKGTSEVKAGMSLVDGAGEKFQRIVQGAREVATQIEEVSAAAEQMSASSEEIAASMQEMTSVANESATEVKSVAASSEQQLATMEEITSSAENLNRVAQELQEAISEYRV